MNVSELRNDLLARGILPNAVRYEDGVLTAPEYYCISKWGSVWEVYYFERGNQNELRLFSDEESACAYLKSVLDNDRTVWKNGQRRS
jgi:hypothetical protein